MSTEHQPPAGISGEDRGVHPPELERELGGTGFSLVRAEELASVALMAVVLGAVTLQIVFRYVLRSPLPWTDELARFSVVWLTFFSAAFVAARERHIVIEIMDDILGERGIRYLRILARILVIGACVVVVVGSVAPIQMAGRRHTTALDIPLSLLALAVPVGFGLIAIHSFRSLTKLLRGGRVIEDSKRAVI